MLLEQFNEERTLIATGKETGDLSVRQVISGTTLWHTQAHPGAILSLDWSPDGRRLASGGQDGVVCVWDTRSGVLLDSRVLASPINQLRWSPDGDSLAVALENLPIRLWHVCMLTSTGSS